MKKFMKPFVRAGALLLLGLSCLTVFAQQPPQPCHITITSDFESQCLMPLEKDSVYNEEPEAIIACQENTVTYTASANTGGIPIIQWSWSVAGASTWTDNGNGTITVTWGTGSTGQITVEITTASDYTCSLTQNIKLIEKPEIYVTTIPSYTELQNGDKIIYVCKGETIEFTDLSNTTNSDIVGYYWECDNPTIISTTPNFRIENVMSDCTVTHRIYNNCGCYDEEEYIIKMMVGDILELSCYGTVCQNATVTYTALHPTCDQYSWYVEGGTIIGSQNQQTVTVQWDHPQNGYGIIGIDGFLCGENTCPTMLSKKIPIIKDTVTISGQEVACVDEAVLYSIPLYGSTEYHWNIQPSNGADVFDVNGANQKTVVFTQPGTYHITVSYNCDFLECGDFTSKPLTVVVKPKLEIDGEDRICVTNTCDLKTDPNVPALWKVQDLSNNNQTIHTLPNSAIFSFTFPHAGKYRITAENPNYCRPASFVITVVSAPPTPTVSDFDPTNPHTACPHSGILLKANPVNPDYTILWEPSCTDADPQMVSGNNVTINYNNTVCDINAYNYDRVLECRSANPYVHTVNEFQLAGHNLPSNITVCPGAELSWSVPYQSSVIYEWQLQDNYQYCASLQGDIFSNSISLLINELSSYPVTFKLKLKREYCSNETDYHIINITVDDHIETDLSINAPGNICQNTQVQLIGSGGNSNTYVWYIDDYIHYGNPINHTFNHAGNVSVTLKCNPYYSCPNSNYYPTETILVNVNPEPPVTDIGFNGSQVYVIPALSTTDYDFDWTHTSVNDNIVNAIPGVYDYTCTVTNKQTHCNKTISANVQPCLNTLNVVLVDGYDLCTKQISFQVTNPTGPITWDIKGGTCSIVSTSGNYNENITLSILEAGNYTIKARIGGDPCESGSYSIPIEFVPDFIFEKACSQIIIHNKSSYINGNKMVGINYNGTPLLFQANQSTIPVSVASGTYTFNLVSFDNVSLSTPCTLGTLTIENTSGLPVTINLPNPTNPLYQTCDNTAIQLTASIPAPHSIVSTLWDFGDQSSSSHSNPIYHTFKQNYPYYYSVTATIIDENACTLTGTINVRSNGNNLIPGAIVAVDPVQCDGNPRQIRFNNNPSGTSFVWSTGCIPLNTNQVSVFHTGNYHVDVQNQNYCKAKKNTNISFNNIPMALIVTASSVYCQGETIKFYGSPDPDSNSYTFDWVITEISTGISFNSHYATVSYTPNHAGNYTVSLTITNSEGCSNYTTETITVNPTPQKPTIFFNGNECLDQGAVNLSGTTPTTPQSIINWSNGYTGPNADYFTAGEAHAWYYDINTGCKSKEATIHIEPQPDFDALLAGCYEKCKSFFRDNPTLPVWGLTSGRESINWKWYLNNNNIDNGTVYYPNYFLSLPLTTFGDYNLGLDYHNGNCGTLTSPTLTINPKDTCDCKDLDVKYKYKWYVKDCKIVYEVKVTVCNNSNLKGCVSNLEQLFGQPNVDLVYTDFTFTPLNPGDCYSFVMTLVASQFIPSSTLSFRIYDGCTNCTTDFSIDLMPEKFDCEMEMKMEHIDIIPELSSSVAGYYKIIVNVAPAMNVLAFWSDPPMVIDYWYDGGAIVHSLGMIDMSVLSQLMADDEDVCFYAITCENDKLCFRKYCFPARKLYDMIEGTGVLHGMAKSTVNGNDSESDLLSSNPRLMPNPTTGDVNVIGTDAEVIEVLVMDMNGRKMATFDNTDQFNVSNLASGIYIVRVRTKSASDEPEIITYLKLIKK